MDRNDVEVFDLKIDKPLSLDAKIKLLEGIVNDLLKQHESINDLFEDLCEIQRNKIKIPHRCPICNGLMCDSDGNLCSPCDGNGIVWG